MTTPKSFGFNKTSVWFLKFRFGISVQNETGLIKIDSLLIVVLQMFIFRWQSHVVFGVILWPCARELMKSLCVGFTLRPPTGTTLAVDCLNSASSLMYVSSFIYRL